MNDRHAITAFAMERAGLNPQEYDVADSHIFECACVACEKFKEYLRVKQIICDWNRFLDERKKP